MDGTKTPHLEFGKAMEAEHCSKTGCMVLFVTTTNYKITTTARLEWSYTVEGKPCPDMQHGRRMPVIKELQELPLVKAAKLSYEEVVAVVLYTGPMVCHPTVQSLPFECFGLQSCVCVVYVTYLEL